jgi:hypothetical protein
MRFVFYVAVGHVNEIKGDLNPSNYPATLSRLQNLGNVNIQAILEFANGAWRKDHPAVANKKKKKKGKKK